MTEIEKTRIVRSIRRGMRRLRAAGYEIFGMDDCLVLVDPETVALVGSDTLPDARLKHPGLQDRIEDIGFIDSSGAW